VSNVLRELARRYERTQAGRTGSGQRDLLVDYEELLRGAGSKDGDSRVIAERELRDAEASGIIGLESHRRDPALILRVRFSPGKEADLYKRLGDLSPCIRRQKDAALFEQALAIFVPESYQADWFALCDCFKKAAINGDPIQPFYRDDLEGNRELLEVLVKVLWWKGESLIRFVSSVICGDSKRLSELQPRIEPLLLLITAGKFARLADFGILANPYSTLVHGPLRLWFDKQHVDLGVFEGVTSVSSVDLARLTGIETCASRCVTVENETVLLELAKLQSEVILIGTNGYTSSAALLLLDALPQHLEFWHFGDSDPAGFDILRDLRVRSQRDVRSLHMQYRPGTKGSVLTADDHRLIDRLMTSVSLTHEEKNQLQAMLQSGDKGEFEQESLGRPGIRSFPFF
jgi:Uncharacterized protein conserved in bacteria C-term(DUF2220)